MTSSQQSQSTARVYWSCHTSSEQFLVNSCGILACVGDGPHTFQHISALGRVCCSCFIFTVVHWVYVQVIQHAQAGPLSLLIFVGLLIYPVLVWSVCSIMGVSIVCGVSSSSNHCTCRILVMFTQGFIVLSWTVVACDLCSHRLFSRKSYFCHRQF